MIICRAILYILFIFPMGAKALTHCDDKIILGRVEKVELLEQHIILDSKLDTGADFSSLSAEDITLIPAKKPVSVRFVLRSKNASPVTITAPIVRMAHILKRKDEQANQGYAVRPVIRLPVCIGGMKKNLEVNLIDRSQFHYPLLIGAEALNKLHVLVDVSREYYANVGGCA